MTKYKDLAIQLVIVTAGVFIALVVDSLVEWNQQRRLVNEARATLNREIGDNQRRPGKSARQGHRGFPPACACARRRPVDDRSVWDASERELRAAAEPLALRSEWCRGWGPQLSAAPA
jgi:hypothetical protein